MLGQSLGNQEDTQTGLYILDFIPVKINSNTENTTESNIIDFKTDLEIENNINNTDNINELNPEQTVDFDINTIESLDGSVLVGESQGLREYHGTIEISPGLFLKPAYDINKNIITYKESNMYNIVDNLGNYYNTDKTILKYIITNGETFVIAKDKALENKTSIYELQAISTGYKSQATIEMGNFISQYSMTNSELETAALDNQASYQMVRFIYDNSENIETDNKTLKNIDDFSISQLDIEAQGLTKRVQIGQTYLIKNAAQHKLPMTIQIGVYNGDTQEVHLYKSEQSYEQTNQVSEYNVYSMLVDAIEQQSITGDFQEDPEEQMKLAEINEKIASNN